MNLQKLENIFLYVSSFGQQRFVVSSWQGAIVRGTITEVKQL